MEADLLASLGRDLVVESEGLPVDPLHVGRGVVGGDEAGGVPGGARGEVELVQEENLPPSPGQVVGRADPHYTSSHHHRVHCRAQANTSTAAIDFREGRQYCMMNDFIIAV